MEIILSLPDLGGEVTVDLPAAPACGEFFVIGDNEYVVTDVTYRVLDPRNDPNHPHKCRVEVWLASEDGGDPNPSEIKLPDVVNKPRQ